MTKRSIRKSRNKRVFDFVDISITRKTHIYNEGYIVVNQDRKNAFRMILLSVLLCIGFQIGSLNGEIIRASVFENSEPVLRKVDSHYLYAEPIDFEDVLAQREEELQKGIYLNYYDYGNPDAHVSNDSIAKMAATQLGNYGGATYRSWYGGGNWDAWCAIFVTWCADQCGYIDAGICPMIGSVNGQLNHFIANNQWASGRITPSAGMYIFFDYDVNGSGDHVGLVESCDGTTIYCIEGNYNNGVYRTSYPVGYYSIMGYGMPDY